MQDPISTDRLALVHPELARRVQAADAALAKQGHAMRVAEGLRSFAESDADFAKGRSTPGPIVTNARGGFSWHNFGMAVDCYPFVEGASGNLDWDANDPVFHAMVTAMEAEGLAWGGEWHSIQDPPHFQLVELPVSPSQTDRNAFTQGGLARVWANYAHLGGTSVPPLSASMDPDFVRSALLVLIDPYFWRSFLAHGRAVLNRFRHHRRTEPDVEYVWQVFQFREGAMPGEDFEFQGIFSSKEKAIEACRTDLFCVSRWVLDQESPIGPVGELAYCWYPHREQEPNA